MSYKRFSLRPLRLTYQTTGDITECRDIHRGLINVDEVPAHKHIPEEGNKADADTCQSIPEQEHKSLDCGVGHCDVSSTELDEPTSYELECKASVGAWEEIRPSVLHVVTESSAMRIRQQCLNCKQNAILRCLQCGPVAFFCEDCFSDLHRRLNIFHLAEKWEVG